MKFSKLIYSTLSLTIILSIIGCDKDNCTISKAGDVVIYTNKNIPSQPDLQILLQKKHTIDLNKIGIKKLGQIAMDSAKNIYILDNNDNTIKKIDQGGNILTSFMRQGDGPGEVTDCGSMTILKDTVIASDYMTGKVVKYDLNGKFLTQSYRKNLRRLMDFISCGDSGYIGFIIKYKPTDEFMFVTRNLVLFDNSFNKVKILKEAEYKSNIVDEMDYSYTETFQVDNNSKKIFIASNSDKEFLIEVYDFRGNLIEKIKKHYIPVCYAEAEIKQFNNQARQYNPNYNFPFKYKKAINSMLAGNDNSLWVQLADSSLKNQNIAYDIFKNGAFLNKVIIPISAKDDALFFLNQNTFYQLNADLGKLEIYQLP